MRKSKGWFDGKLKLLLIIGALFFAVRSLIWGRIGLVNYYKMQKKLQREEERFSRLQAKIKSIKKEIESLKRDDFLVEKIARQDLQMAHPDEKMYII